MIANDHHDRYEDPAPYVDSPPPHVGLCADGSDCPQPVAPEGLPPR